MRIHHNIAWELGLHVLFMESRHYAYASCFFSFLLFLLLLVSTGSPLPGVTANSAAAAARFFSSFFSFFSFCGGAPFRYSTV